MKMSAKNPPKSMLGDTESFSTDLELTLSGLGGSEVTSKKVTVFPQLCSASCNSEEDVKVV